MKQNNEKTSITKKVRRTFSESFKREKVNQIELGQITVIQVSKIYEVSPTAVYKWLHKYAMTYRKEERVVVEKKSEAHKTLELLKKVAELEQVLGKKQLELDYLSKVIDLGSEELGVDIKKKFATK